MSDAQTDFNSTLNDLIETCIDGQRGFQAAADAVESPDLKGELMRYSEQRGDFAAELQRLVGSSGEEPKHSGSLSGDLHRGWMNLRKALTSQDQHAILAECERGEDSAVQAYRDALDEALPPQLALPVASQYQTIQSTHDRVRDLRDASGQKPA
ncbi:MAG TPA: PA2169 family four-helix-bundle protein [Tepidisphaeraceae bacterium]|jgi:uncharacterized protein (TIGR02284 family)